MKRTNLNSSLERNHLLAMTIVLLFFALALLTSLSAFKFYRNHTKVTYLHYQGTTLQVLDDTENQQKSGKSPLRK
jgi:hypothetical protein